MVSALLAVALRRSVAPSPPSRPGVRTHQLLMAILGAAQRTGQRRSVMTEIVRALSHRGVYRGSREELLPWRGDRRTVVLPLAATLATLVRPDFWRFFTDGAVSGYALAPQGWHQLRASAGAADVTAASA
jgi:hypothetical protein